MANLFSQLLSDHKGGNLLIKGPISVTTPSGFCHQVTHHSEVVRLLGVRWCSFSSYLLDEDHDNIENPVHDTQRIRQLQEAARTGQAAGRPDLTNEFNVVEVVLYEGESRERRILLHVHSSDVELL